MEKPHWWYDFAEDYSSNAHTLKCSGSWEVEVEPVSQVSLALKVIENVRKISSTVWVNKNQCERIAVRFTLIAEGLRVMGLDKNFPGGKALDGGSSSSKDYPAFDELLAVLRRGEALVSSYGNDGVWRVITSAVSRTDNREAFLEIHLELDTLTSELYFEGSNGKYVELASGVGRSDLLTEDAEKDLKELPKSVEKLTRINPQRVSNLDLKTLHQVVTEKIKPVGGDEKLPSYLKIDLATVETKGPIRELVRQSEQGSTYKDGWALVRSGSWLGCEFAIKVFKSGEQSERNKEQLVKEVGALMELRHPHVIRLVGFGQGSDQYFFLMEKMDADLRNFMKRKLEPALRPKPGPFSRSKELDIITQIAKGMYYLHTQQYVHVDLKCSNILVKESGGYLEVKIADPRSAMKLGGDWDQAAFEIACSTRRPRWTAPEAIKHFGGTRPSSESLLKVDVYSFAMTCYEIVTGKYPFDGMKDDALVEQIEAGVRPELPGELDDDLKGAITSCWVPDPNKRPNFQSICDVLDHIRSKQSAIGINKSSRKNVVLRLFKRIPQVNGLLGQVRKNANPPAIESSAWDDQKKAHELQLSDSTVPFAEHLGIKPSDLEKLSQIRSGDSTKVYTRLGCTFAVKKFKVEPAKLSITSKTTFGLASKHTAVKEPVTFEETQSLLRVLVQVLELKASSAMEFLGWAKKAGPSFYHKGTARRKLIEYLIDLIILNVSSNDNLQKSVKECLAFVKYLSEANHEDSLLTLQRKSKLIELLKDYWTLLAAEDGCEAGVPGVNVVELKVENGVPLYLHEARICSSTESKFKPFHSALDALKTVVDGDGENEPERNKTRTRNWSAEETRTMLELMEEAPSVDELTIWDFVSENLWDKCGFDRSSNSCENLWNALLHSYKATQDDESKIRACTDLDLECREIIERILASKSFKEKTRSIQRAVDFPSCQNDLPFCQFQSSRSEVEVLHDVSWTTGRLGDNMGLFGFVDEVLRDDLLDEGSCSSEYQGLSGDITATNQSHAEVTRITEPHYETNANFAGTKRSAATVMEDELITRMAPFVNKQIEDALKPLISVLRGREEDEQKYRQKLLVLEEEMLALKRQMMLFTHRGTTFEYNH